MSICTTVKGKDFTYQDILICILVKRLGGSVEITSEEVSSITGMVIYKEVARDLIIIKAN